MDLTEKTLSTQKIYDGKVVNLRKDTVLLPNGATSFREVIHNSGGATIIAEFDGNIYFVKQFRYPYGKTILELPAGKINEGENPLDCARRELEEETGLVAKNIRLLQSIYPTPAYTDEVIYIYVAEGIEKGSIHLDDDEFLNVVPIKVEKVKEMLKSGEIHDAKTLVALYKYFAEK